MTDRIPDTPCSAPPCEYNEGQVFPCALHQREHKGELLEMFRVPAEVLAPPKSITEATLRAEEDRRNESR